MSNKKKNDEPTTPQMHVPQDYRGADLPVDELVGEVPGQPEKQGVKAKPVSVGLGSTGEDVVKLQEALNDRIDRVGHGFKVHVDGVFGAKTNSAVQVAQAEDGLPVIGDVTPEMFHR